MDTSTPGGNMAFDNFAALAEFERDLIGERTRPAWRPLAPVATAVGRPTVMSAEKVPWRARCTPRAGTRARRSPRSSG
jgi:DNA invertase Pin-like site-specific DNA recombinase